jgi:hypothetical protein
MTETDPRLLNLLGHSDVLDNDTSAEQVERCRQYSEILAQSVPQMAYDFENCQPTEHPNPLDALIFRLSLATYNYCDALSRLAIRDRDGDKWAREYHEKAAAEWFAARKAAEMYVYGKVRSTTVIAGA